MTTSPEAQPASDMFITETMAELSARQGRTADAIAIYRRLLEGAAPDDQRRTRWGARLAVLAGGAAPPIEVVVAPALAPSPAAPAVPAPVAAPAVASVAASAAEPVLRLPLVVREPVRSGQIVYAQHRDQSCSRR